MSTPVPTRSPLENLKTPLNLLRGTHKLCVCVCAMSMWNQPLVPGLMERSRAVNRAAEHGGADCASQDSERPKWEALSKALSRKSRAFVTCYDSVC